MIGAHVATLLPVVDAVPVVAQQSLVAHCRALPRSASRVVTACAETRVLVVLEVAMEKVGFVNGSDHVWGTRTTVLVLTHARVVCVECLELPTVLRLEFVFVSDNERFVDALQRALSRRIAVMAVAVRISVRPVTLVRGRTRPACPVRDWIRHVNISFLYGTVYVFPVAVWQ